MKLPSQKPSTRLSTVISVRGENCKGCPLSVPNASIRPSRPRLRRTAEPVSPPTASTAYFSPSGPTTARICSVRVAGLAESSKAIMWSAPRRRSSSAVEERRTTFSVRKPQCLLRRIIIRPNAEPAAVCSNQAPCGTFRTSRVITQAVAGFTKNVAACSRDKLPLMGITWPAGTTAYSAQLPPFLFRTTTRFPRNSLPFRPPPESSTTPTPSKPGVAGH